MFRSILVMLAVLAFSCGCCQASDDSVCVQTYLTEAGYDVGAVDGPLGKKSLAAAADFAAMYTELHLPELSAATVAEWCKTLSSPVAADVLVTRQVPPAAATKETIGKRGGLNFAHPLVLENYSGFGKLWHDFQASLSPGRVAVETDSARVHSGKSSIRMHILRGDCGWTTHRDDGGWNDCDHANERVETNAEPLRAGEYYYALSVMVGSNILALEPFGNAWAHNEINLYQWFQFDSGACFDLLFNVKLKKLDFSIYCSTGVADTQYKRVILEDSRTDVWHEFIFHIRWSFGRDGFFRVLQNGKMVMNYNGPTMTPEGRPLLVDHPQVYLYGESMNPGSTAREHYRTPVTAWFDDMIRTKSIKAIQKVYKFDPEQFKEVDAAIPITDLHP